MGRFFDNLKTRTIAGANGPSSSELQTTGQTIFIEKRSSTDLGELILVQKANILQHQNQTLPHPGLSAVNTTTVSEGATDAPLNPIATGFEVFEIQAVSCSNAGASSADVEVSIGDGSNYVPIASASIGAGAESTIDLGKLHGRGMIDSSLFLVASASKEVTFSVAYSTVSVK
tara:strand:+ start:622 stop:1140 length:519 start_codon:yes stop_codon:yes gene_type:complete